MERTKKIGVEAALPESQRFDDKTHQTNNYWLFFCSLIIVLKF